MGDRCENNETICLQFEDVVFRNKYVRSYINDATAEFFKNHLNHHDPLALCSLIHILHQVNRGEGSVSVGNYLNLVNDCEDALQQYNHEVYTPLSVSTISRFIQKKDFDLIHTLINIKRTYGFKFILCSDAPLAYCVAVFKAMHVSLFDLFDFRHMYTSDLVRCLKSNIRFFEYIEEELHNSRRPLQFIGDDPSGLSTNHHLDENHWNVSSFTSPEEIYAYLLDKGTKGIR